MENEKEDFIQEIKNLYIDVKYIYKSNLNFSLKKDLNNMTISQLAYVYHELMNMLP